MAVNGTNRIYIPNSEYTTARVNAYSMFGGDTDLITAGVRFGYTTAGGSGAQTGAYRAVLTITLPEIYDVHGDTTKTLFNSDSPVGAITDLVVELNPSGDRSNSGKYAVYYVKKHLRQHKPGINGAVGTGLPHSTKHVQMDRLTWDGYADSEMQAGNTVDDDHTTTGGVASAWGFLEWAVPGGFLKGPAADSTGAADLDQATDYGHGPNGKIHLFNCENAGINIYIPLLDLVAAKSLTWGDTFQLLIKHEGQIHDASNVLEDAEWGDEAGATTVNDITCAASTFGSAVSSNIAAVHIIYEDAPPTKPIIKMVADATDFITPIITFDTFPTDADLQTVKLHWNTSNTFTTASTGGAEGNANLTSFNKDEYRDLKGTAFLATQNQQYYVTAIAADNVSYVQGNSIGKKRMTCSGSLSAGTAIGTELTLTITGANGDYAGKFIKYGVNWNGDGTATNDSISDYNIATLDEEATSATITHTFDKSIGGNYNINIFTVDRDGFRSDFTQGATRNIVVSNPVAKLNASRDSLVR